MVEDQAINELVAITEGDLRKSITILQSLACSGEMIGVDQVHEMSGGVELFSLCLSGATNRLWLCVL